jgi:hypothetical protein
MPYLRYLCLFASIVVSNTYCDVFFVLYFFVLCTLCCQFLWIVFVLCTLCCQFLWIVLFWLLLRCSLTFVFESLINENRLFITHLTIIKIDAYELQSRTLTLRNPFNIRLQVGCVFDCLFHYDFVCGFMYMFCWCLHSKDVFFHWANLWFVT